MSDDGYPYSMAPAFKASRRTARTVVLLGVWLLLIGCVHRNSAWKHLNTRELGCTPFEIVIAQGVEYRVATIAGVIYALGAPDGTAPVEGVRVVLRRLGGREEAAATTTSSDGRFEFPGFPEGGYQIETCREGFNSVVVPVWITRHPRGEPLILRLSIAN